jgi:hypothetical protein
MAFRSGISDGRLAGTQPAQDGGTIGQAVPLVQLRGAMLRIGPFADPRRLGIVPHPTL